MVFWEGGLAVSGLLQLTVGSSLVSLEDIFLACGFLTCWFFGVLQALSSRELIVFFGAFFTAADLGLVDERAFLVLAAPTEAAESATAVIAHKILNHTALPPSDWDARCIPSKGLDAAAAGHVSLGRRRLQLSLYR